MEMITISQCIWCIELFRAPSGSQGRIAFPRALTLRQHCLCQRSHRGSTGKECHFNQSAAFHTALSFETRTQPSDQRACFPFPAAVV